MRVEKKEEPPPKRHRFFDWLAGFFLHDRREFLEFFDSQARRGLLDDSSHIMVRDVLRLHELRVRDVMVPRSQMKVVSSSAGYDEILATVVKNGHSGFPVVGDGLDDIEGILFAKTLSGAGVSSSANGGFNIRDHICEPFVVPESRRLSRLLDGFKLAGIHLAVVVDEYGGTSGLVTSGDVMRQIFNDYADRDDVSNLVKICQLEPGSFLVDGLTTVAAFSDYFALSADGEQAETVGGMMVNRLGHLPVEGEGFELGELKLEVKSTDGRRVLQLIVKTAGKQ